MSDLGERLARLGLSQYLEAFVTEGFDTWDTVLDITESDLGSLGVKLGHRRKLQRAIAEWRGQYTGRPLPSALSKAGSIDGSYRSGDDSATESKPKQFESAASAPTTNAKRKYRRHPKPDEHAPERPPSAYVIFSNLVRETLKGRELSFTEIAKVVGEKWQVLPADEREACERQANTAKERYYAALAEYKKTPEYESYQRYLEEFRAKHAPPTKEAEGKRSRFEPETSSTPTTTTNSTNTTTSSAHSGNNSHDVQDRAPDRRISSAHSDLISGHGRLESSPPTGPSRLPSGPTNSSKSASPAVLSRSGFNSPRSAEQPYSSMSTSPLSGSLHKENSFETTSSAMARDARDQTDATMAYSSAGYSHAPSYSASAATPTSVYNNHFQPSVDLPSRRSARTMNQLPPLTHEDTTLSSDSGQGSYSGGYNAPNLPAIDTSKASRLLPAPIPSMSASHSPLDRPPILLPAKAPSVQSVQDYRSNSSLAALLRAGELARVTDTDADDEDMDAPAYA